MKSINIKNISSIYQDINKRFPPGNSGWVNLIYIDPKDNKLKITVVYKLPIYPNYNRMTVQLNENLSISKNLDMIQSSINLIIYSTVRYF